MRQHGEVVAQRRALQRIARAGEQPVELVEARGVSLQRQAQQLEVGAIGREAALPLVHGERQLHAFARQLRAAHAIGGPDLEAEAWHGGGDAGPRIVDQAQRVGLGRVRVRDGGKRADAGARTAASGLAGGEVGDAEIVVGSQAARQREPRAGGIDVVVAAFDQDLPLERAGALHAGARGSPCPARHRAHAAEVLVPCAGRRQRTHAVDAQAADAQAVGDAPPTPGRGQLEDVHRREPGQAQRIDGEEEPAYFVVEIAQLVIERLAGDLADGIEPVLHHVALLLRVDTAQLERTDLPDHLNAEIVGGNGGGDEAAGGRLERNVAGLDAAQHFVLEALVPHLQVVVGVEFALAVEVHVDVQSLPDDARGDDLILRIGRDRRETGTATREREQAFGGGTTEIGKLVGFELQPQVEAHPQVGVGAEHAAILPDTADHAGRRLRERCWGHRHRGLSPGQRPGVSRACCEQARAEIRFPRCTIRRRRHPRSEPAARFEGRVARYRELGDGRPETGAGGILRGGRGYDTQSDGQCGRGAQQPL